MRMQWCGCLALAAGVLLAGGGARSQDLTPLKYNQPGLVVDLGVGLWAFPLPMDYDQDGDHDLVVSCPDKPYNGVYFFENPGGRLRTARMMGVGTPRSKWVWAPVPAFLITHPTAGPILVDTAFHASVAAQPAANLGRVMARMSRARVDPDGTRVRIDPSGAEIRVDSGRIEVEPLPGEDRSVEVNNQ